MAAAPDTAGPRLCPDLAAIAAMVRPASRVLDVGCGDGTLLAWLEREKGVQGRGLEVKQSRVNACVARGLSVVHGDADHDLVHYPDNAFDYVILSRTLQSTYRPREALVQITRIGACGLVSFANFGYWRVRWDYLRRGRMPLTATLPDPWYETQNIHLCTIADFVDLCRDAGIAIERALALDHRGRVTFEGNPGFRANLMGEVGVFMVRRR